MSNQTKRYELLQDDDVIQEGDEYRGEGKGYHWVGVCGFDIGRAVKEACTTTIGTYLYRRKVVPVTVPAPEPARPSLPEGYRFLEDHEVIQEGDLWIDPENPKDQWDSFCMDHCYGEVACNKASWMFARKKEAATPQAPACPLRWENETGSLQWFDGKVWMDVPWESAKVTTVKPTTATGGDL